MLKFNAAAFYGATVCLQQFLTAVENDQKDALPDAVITDALLLNWLRDNARALRDSISALGLPLSLKSANGLLRVIEGRVPTYSGMFSWHRDITSRLRDELENIVLLNLDPRERDYYEPLSPLFGSNIETNFVSAVFEIDEASKCLALGRYTACVFHLMRVMEIAIRAISRCLGIPDPVRTGDRNWGNILRSIKDELDAHIGSAPAKKWSMSGDKDLFDSVYVSIDAVRVAWRNPTMHVEKKYTGEEAEHVFAAVRGFMTQLASRCDESGDPKA